jgi:fucose 4-O-acetylase-like acetyltransferase
LVIRNSSLALKVLSWLAIVLIHFVLNTDVNYRFTNSDILIGNSLQAEHLFEFKRLFFDGWFPIFPWLSFSILGSIVGEIYQKKWINTYAIFISILACALSSIYLVSNPIMQEIRNGYVELFYPVELPYFLFTTTLTLAVSMIAIQIRHLPKLISQLAKLGEHSLFVYVIHTVIISFVLQPLAKADIHINSVYSYSIFILIVYILVKGLQFVLKKNYLEFIPIPIRQILGLR